MKTLIKFEANWADEFDCQQFTVVDDLFEAEEWIEEIVADEYHGFGSNQGWEKGEITRENFTVYLIEDEEADFLNRAFGPHSYGVGPL